jgi:predicted dehydrogenase
MQRYILIGTGGFGAVWCSQFLPRLRATGKAECVAAVDLAPEALRNAREHLGVPAERCFGDARRAIAEVEADFAIVVVPPAYHEEVVGLALDRGLDVLCEKPIAGDMAACARILERVRRSGRRMAITMSHRFDQDKQTLSRLLRGGAHGRLDYLVGRNTWACRAFPAWGAFRYRIPDPLLVEGLVHHFDCMRELAGADAATVYARSWNPPWSEFAGDCQAMVTVEMANGVRVLYEGAKANASELNGWTRDYWRAECEHATLELDERRLRAITGSGANRAAAELPLDDRPAWGNAWLAERFVDWRAGGEPPPTTIEDNIQCAALLFAAIESAHAGRPVDVQEFLRRHLEPAAAVGAA